MNITAWDKKRNTLHHLYKRRYETTVLVSCFVAIVICGWNVWNQTGVP